MLKFTKYFCFLTKKGLTFIIFFDNILALQQLSKSIPFESCFFIRSNRLTSDASPLTPKKGADLSAPFFLSHRTLRVKSGSVMACEVVGVAGCKAVVIGKARVIRKPCVIRKIMVGMAVRRYMVVVVICCKAVIMARRRQMPARVFIHPVTAREHKAQR